LLLRIKPLKRAMFIVAAVLLVFGAAEMLLTAGFGDAPSADRLYFNLNPLANENLYIYDPALFWRLKPGALDKYSRINRLGMRGPPVKKSRKSEILRILLIGDSIPYGFMLEDDQTIGAHMRRLLGDKGAVEVINGGVVGYSSFQTMRYFQRELASWKPDIVVIYVGNNDWIDTPTWPDNAQPVLRESIGSAWNALRRLALYRSMRSFLLKSHLVEARLKVGGKSITRVSRGDYAANLLVIRNFSEKIGATPLFCRIVHFPGNPQCATSGLYSTGTDLQMVDTLKPFEDMCMPEARRYFMDGIHPTSEGALLMAKAIAEKINGLTNLKQ
jgi:lysophospholipase L1-like esterase